MATERAKKIPRPLWERDAWANEVGTSRVRGKRVEGNDVHARRAPPHPAALALRRPLPRWGEGTRRDCWRRWWLIRAKRFQELGHLCVSFGRVPHHHPIAGRVDRWNAIRFATWPGRWHAIGNHAHQLLGAKAGLDAIRSSHERLAHDDRVTTSWTAGLGWLGHAQQQKCECENPGKVSHSVLLRDEGGN
jgi:hypothetical protein